MENIRLLDCTLRDGGYINQWGFGEKTIRSIASRLTEAGTDIIEVGFLRNCTWDKDKTLFPSIKKLKKILPANSSSTRFAAMALHNQYDVEKLEPCDGSIDIIRVTFHDYDIEEGLVFCEKVKEKGYQLFVNPINIMGYSDRQLLKLLEKVNRLHPYGFSIVDTFGSMTGRELTRIYSLCENNLEKDIVLGLHLHENMAQSFSLAQSFLKMREQARSCVLDASLNGMGRVPGNLCIELIMDYLNKHFGKSYDIDPVLDAIEEYISPIKKQEPWGYMAEYFLSAKYNLHRNYAEYLLTKGALSSRDMHRILQMIPEEKKSAFDQNYIEYLYHQYENHTVSDEKTLDALRKAFRDKKALLLAPGPGLKEYRKQVEDYQRAHRPVPISVNFFYDHQEEGYAFFSNSKRFQEYRSLRKPGVQVILTSNITTGIRPDDHVINLYRLSQEETERGNSGILLLRLLLLLGVREGALAGFDGYIEGEENYLEGYFGRFASAPLGDNRKIARELKKLGGKMRLTFVTPSAYEEEM